MARSRVSHRKITVASVLKNLESRAPSATAESWDNVGLLAGDASQEVSGAVVCIDLTEEAIETAIRKKYNLIVNHHPCIFPKSRGLSRVTGESLVYRAVRAGIAVVACHTNFDQCALEVVHTVAHGLGVEPKGRLHDSKNGDFLKLVTYVPSAQLEKVRLAISEAGAGNVGNYDQCSFSSQGIGTFRGSSSTRPAIGKPGKLERVKETRLETILPIGLKNSVISALRDAHPYEEVAYDLHPVVQKPSHLGLVSGLGYGFWGEFPKSKAFSELAKNVKLLFNVKGFWLTDPVPSQIHRLAYVAGKGASFISAAADAGCDLFITGEAGYHDALKGSRRGMAVMEIGHRESEKFFLFTLEGWLNEAGLKTVSLNLATQILF